MHKTSNSNRKVSGSSTVIPWKDGKDDRGIFFMGASPLIYPIGNSKVVIVAFVLALLSLLSPVTNPSNPCCNRRPSNYSCDSLVGVINDSDVLGACCFTTLPVSRY